MDLEKKNIVKQCNLKIKTIKNRAKMTSDYTRRGFYGLKRVIKRLKREKGKKKYFYMGKNIRLKTSTQKNNVFVSNYEKNNGKCKCDICGIEAKYFALEKSPDNTSNIYHFNLYTVHPKTKQELYFNIDHIKPRAKGGANTLDNMQLTCETCNSKKGDKFSKWNHLKSKVVEKIKTIFSLKKKG